MPKNEQYDKEEVQARRPAWLTCCAPPITHADGVVVSRRANPARLLPPPCQRTRWTTLATVIHA